MSKHNTKRNLTMLERKTCIRILKKAKKKLERYEQNFICDAITMTYWGGATTTVCRINMKLYLKDWVMNNLAGYMSYAQWVGNAHPKKTQVLPEEFTRKVRQARIAWVEWMINELEQGR